MTGSADAFRFGDVGVDPAAFRLTRGGVAARIEPKALELLIYLIEHRDRVVPKQELLDQVWKATVVTDNALTRAIAHIRKVLGDDPDAPKYVQTVPTRGYRFVGDLVPADERQPVSAVEQAAPTGPTSRTTWVAAALVLLVTVFAMAALVSIVAFSLWRGRRAQNTPAVRAPIAAQPIAPSERLQSFPAFSPDGNSLAFSSVDSSGVPHIYSMPVGGGEEVQITHGDGESQPTWSPDGRSIAYASWRRGGIWIAALAGGAPLQVTSFGAAPQWSPDGSEIAFQSGEVIACGWTSFDAQPPSTIWIVDVASKRTSPLTHEGAPPGAHATPAWRPDGKRIAFSSCDLESCAVYTVARDGSGLNGIARESVKLTSPVFEHDGRTVDYVRVRYNHSDLFAQAIDRDGQEAGAAVAIRSSATGVMQRVVLSRDGYRVAWAHAEERSDLFSVRLRRDGSADGAPQRVTNNPTVRHTFPAFSADGSKVAFCAFAAGEDGGVWVADKDGRNARPVAVGPGLKQQTQWSRRGWDIVYAVWQGSGPAVMKTSIVTGRSSTVVALTHGSSAPVLSPDETEVAFNRTIDGRVSVWVAPVSGGAWRRLTAEGEGARYPIWSPGGKELAVQVRRPDGSSAVGIVSAAGGPLRIVAGGPGEAWPYSFSPDGRRIAFSARRNGVWNVWTVPVSGGTPRQITDNTLPLLILRSPAWSPAGDRIVYELDEPKENVWVSEPAVTQ